MCKRTKLSKTLEDFNKTINQLELIDIYRTPSENKQSSQFFSSAHGDLLKYSYEPEFKSYKC